MKRRLTILCSFLFIMLKPSAQKKYTLDECYQLALKNNVAIKKAYNQVIINTIDRQTAQYNQLPSLSSSMGHYFSFGKNIDPVTNIFVNEAFSGGYMSMNLQLKIFSGFSTLLSIKQGNYAIQASEYAKKRIELELLSNVTLSYSRLLFNKEQSIVLRNNIDATAKQLKIVDEKIKAGRLNKYEYYVLNARLNSEKADLITVQNDLSTVMQDLKQLLNMSYKEEMDIASIDTIILSNMPSNEVASANFIEMMLQKHPAIQYAKMNEQVARTGERIAKSSLFPSLSIGGNLVSNYNANERNINGEKITLNRQLNNNLGQNINISLNVPIFSRREFTNRIKKEKINISNAVYAIQDAENTIISNTLRLINDFNAARQTFMATLAALEQNKLSYSMYEEKYKLGLVSSLELITAKDILNTSNSKYLQSKLELFFRYKLLDLLKNYE